MRFGRGAGAGGSGEEKRFWKEGVPGDQEKPGGFEVYSGRPRNRKTIVLLVLILVGPI